MGSFLPPVRMPLRHRSLSCGVLETHAATRKVIEEDVCVPSPMVSWRFPAWLVSAGSGGCSNRDSYSGDILLAWPAQRPSTADTGHSDESTADTWYCPTALRLTWRHGGALSCLGAVGGADQARAVRAVAQAPGVSGRSASPLRPQSGGYRVLRGPARSSPPVSDRRGLDV